MVPHPSVTALSRRITWNTLGSLSESLDKEVQFFRDHTYASSTNKTYPAQKTAFFEFCTQLRITPVPLSQEYLGRYIAFLSRRLAFSSIRQYLNVIRLLHLEAGLSNPLDNNWYVSSILKGAKRVKGHTVSPKLPITIEILTGILTKLNFHRSLGRCFLGSLFVCCFLLLPETWLAYTGHFLILPQTTPMCFWHRVYCSRGSVYSPLVQSYPI